VHLHFLYKSERQKEDGRLKKEDGIPIHFVHTGRKKHGLKMEDGRLKMEKAKDKNVSQGTLS
jgi:hypothetical protein